MWMCILSIYVREKKICINYSILGFYNKWQSVQTPNTAYMLASRTGITISAAANLSY